MPAEEETGHRTMRHTNSSVGIVLAAIMAAAGSASAQPAGPGPVGPGPIGPGPIGPGPTAKGPGSMSLPSLATLLGPMTIEMPAIAMPWTEQDRQDREKEAEQRQ